MRPSTLHEEFRFNNVIFTDICKQIISTVEKINFLKIWTIISSQNYHFDLEMLKTLNLCNNIRKKHPKTTSHKSRVMNKFSIFNFHGFENKMHLSRSPLEAKQFLILKCREIIKTLEASLKHDQQPTPGYDRRCIHYIECSHLHSSSNWRNMEPAMESQAT